MALDALSMDDNFRPMSNPLMFAARQNHHEIVKVYQFLDFIIFEILSYSPQL